MSEDSQIQIFNHHETESLSGIAIGVLDEDWDETGSYLHSLIYFTFLLTLPNLLSTYKIASGVGMPASR